MSLEQQIQACLDNPEQAYQDWYASLTGAETGQTVPYANMPSLETLKKRFSTWYENHSEQLRQLICIEWDYLGKKSHYLHHSHLIVAIVVDIAALSELIHPLHVPVTVTLLSTEGFLDRLCAACPTSEE